MNNIRILRQIREGGIILQDPYKGMFFSGGEPHVVIEAPIKLKGASVILDARVGSPADMMMLLAVTNAVKECGAKEISLLLPYFPGARQDRSESGFAVTSKMFAAIINLQGYKVVGVVDPHSVAAIEDLERCVALSPIPLIEQFRPKDLVGLICPDEGAIPRTEALSKAFGGLCIVHAHKKRDPRTGKLTGFTLDPLPEEGNWLLADDICDAGGTFMGTAGQYLEDPKGTGPLHLWTTHGIYSRGLEELAGYFATIGCSDSFPSTFHDKLWANNPHPQLQVISILENLDLLGGI